MAIQMSIAKHAVCFPSNVLARDGGAHIWNIRLTQDTDNGELTGRGAYLGLDEYEQDAPTAFSGIVREKMANGNYLVEVVSSTNALLVYQAPIVEEEWSDAFNHEDIFYNAGPVVDAVSGATLVEGDVVRAYDLCPGDRFELSAAGFTATPTVGATVALSGTKLA